MAHRPLAAVGVGFALAVVMFSGCLNIGQPDLLLRQIGAGGVPVGYWAVGPLLQKYVDPAIQELYKTLPRQVVILAVEPQNESRVVRELQEMGLEFHLYPKLHMIAVDLPREEFQRVASLTGIGIMYRNEEMRLLLSKAAPYVGANLVWDTYKVRGKGIGVLVVDTGVDGAHPDIKLGLNLVENAAPTKGSSSLVTGFKEAVTSSDADGHGTHVAGIVGGTGKENRGIAFEAKLVGFQAGITDARGETRFESVTVLEAFDYAMERQKKFNLRVVSNSWGANGAFEPYSPVNQATFGLYKAGMLVTFAAGNEGSEGEGTLNKYCVAPWVFCVAAGDYFNRRAGFSSMGTDPDESDKPYDHPDIMASGVAISSAKFGGGGKQVYATKSGTSMATPVVSGAAAVLLSANSKLSPDQLMEIMSASVTPLPTLDVWEAGAGYLNLLNAYKLAVKTTGNLDTFLSGKAKYGGKAGGDSEYAKDPVNLGFGRDEKFLVSSGGQSVDADFAVDLVTTIRGILFLVGTAALTFASYSFVRRAT